MQVGTRQKLLFAPKIQIDFDYSNIIWYILSDNTGMIGRSPSNVSDSASAIIGENILLFRYYLLLKPTSCNYGALSYCHMIIENNIIRW